MSVDTRTAWDRIQQKRTKTTTAILAQPVVNEASIDSEIQKYVLVRYREILASHVRKNQTSVRDTYEI